jgi:hypothetical protein
MKKMRGTRKRKKKRMRKKKKILRQTHKKIYQKGLIVNR